VIYRLTHYHLACDARGTLHEMHLDDCMNNTCLVKFDSHATWLDAFNFLRPRLIVVQHLHVIGCLFLFLLAL